MNKLQNDFTTKQQSEKLVALGMPRLSANFYYDDENEIQIVKDPEFELQNKGYFPCWSVGRLMEIIKICSDLDTVLGYQIAYNTKHKASLLHIVIQIIEDGINEFDFSKLKE